MANGSRAKGRNKSQDEALGFFDKYGGNLLAKNLDDWNENLTKMDFMNHASFLRTNMDNAKIPLYVQREVLPSVKNPRSLKSKDYELASALQSGMLGRSAYATKEALRGILEWEGYSEPSIKAAVAAYEAIETTGNVEQAVVEGLHAFNPRKNPNFDAYAKLQGEFHGLTPDQYASPNVRKPHFQTPAERKLARHGWRSPKQSRRLLDDYQFPSRTFYEMEKNFSVDKRNYIGPAHENSPQDFMTAAENKELANLAKQQREQDQYYREQANDFVDADTYAALTPHTTTDEITAADQHLTGFAKRHNTSWREVFELNKDVIDDPNVVQVGTSLRVPSTSTPTRQVHPRAGGFERSFVDRKMADNHTVDKGNYAGPSQEYSPEDFQTAEQNRRQAERARTARMEAEIEARSQRLRDEQAKRDLAQAKRQAQAEAREDQAIATRARAEEKEVFEPIAKTRIIGETKIEKLGESVAAKSTEENLNAPAQTKTVIGPLGAVDVPKSRVRTKDGRDAKDTETDTSQKKSGDEGWNMFGGKAKSRGGKVTNPDKDKSLSPSGSYRDNFGREIGAYGQFTKDIVGRGDGSAEAGNTRVICTELVRQGLMAPALQRLDIAFTLRRLSPATVRGYHAWAVPYVRLMKRSHLATNFIEPIARWRAEEIAFQMGGRNRPCWPGKLVRVMVEPACWMLGTVLGWVGDPDRFHPNFKAQS